MLQCKQKFDGEGIRFSFASKEKQKTCVCRRKSCKRNEKHSCSPPLPGRPAKLAMRCAKRTAKTGVRPEKMSKLIFSDCRRFSSARKLSLRLPSFRRSLFVVAFKPVRPDGSRAQAGPGAEAWRARSARKTCPWAGFQRRAGRKAPDAEASNVSPLPISVCACFQLRDSMRKQQAKCPLFLLDLYPIRVYNQDTP